MMLRIGIILQDQDRHPYEKWDPEPRQIVLNLPHCFSFNEYALDCRSWPSIPAWSESIISTGSSSFEDSSSSFEVSSNFEDSSSSFEVSSNFEDSSSSFENSNIISSSSRYEDRSSSSFVAGDREPVMTSSSYPPDELDQAARLPTQLTELTTGQSSESVPLLSGSDLYELTAGTDGGGQPTALPLYWGLAAASLLFLLLLLLTAIICFSKRSGARRKRGECAHQKLIIYYVHAACTVD